MAVPDLPDQCWGEIDEACASDFFDGLDDDVKERAQALAVATLSRLTLGRVGGCPITVRPVPKQGCGGIPFGWGQNGAAGSWPFYPYQQINGSVINCCGATSCNCETGCTIKLGTYIGRLDAITIGGIDADLADYAVLDNERIVYQGAGDCPIPTHQDFSKAIGQPGTFSVTYLPAHEVDGLASYAAGELAQEYAKACQGGKCKLPKGITQMVRQGVSITIVSGAFPGGLTGIEVVDSFITLWNPKNLNVRPAVWYPGMPEAVHTS